MLCSIYRCVPGNPNVENPNSKFFFCFLCLFLVFFFFLFTFFFWKSCGNRTQITQTLFCTLKSKIALIGSIFTWYCLFGLSGTHLYHQAEFGIPVRPRPHWTRREKRTQKNGARSHSDAYCVMRCLACAMWIELLLYNKELCVLICFASRVASSPETGTKLGQNPDVFSFSALQPVPN